MDHHVGVAGAGDQSSALQYLLIGSAIVLLGTATGGSVNPARQFGPAVASGRLDLLWVYMLAPLVGAGISAAILNRVHKRREVLTHRLCGTHPNGSPL
ncbi:aquaporin [Nonomuraea sp. NPDC049784]|uniref:aquaporin n=1 Tax=Nonomuraea sp. NPDC049784 TaxID=3154361 RepID=UPI0033FF00A9